MTEIAVKELAYFVCGSGNLTIELFSNRDIEAGTLAHRYLQSKYPQGSNSEVYIKHEFELDGNKYLLKGYIDGVLNIENKPVIEEIKSTTSDLDLINMDDHKEHMAQAKIYAYLYALHNNLDQINVRLTYVSIIDYETNSFDILCTMDELETFTLNALEEYIKFQNMLDEAQISRKKTLEEITFPFKNKRPGQRDLMISVYDTMTNGGILYATAPTGIGKTMACMFGALKALKDREKLFYSTAKGSGKNAPLDAVKLLAKQGLRLKTIDITAKRKACNNHALNCNPDECKFAIGYFDRLKDATMEIMRDYDIYDFDVIQKISNKHKICAFEFSLYLSYFCDLIIADYNYVFDPHAHLVRYFDDDTYTPLVLVDEAHNLVSRGKDMYTAIITSKDIRDLRSMLTGLTPSGRADANKVIEIIEDYRNHLTDKAIYVSTQMDIALNNALNKLFVKVDEIIESNKKKHMPDKDKILDKYFKIMDFLNVVDYFGDNHRLVAEIHDDVITIVLECLDASDLLKKTIDESIKSIAFFSATLKPIEYHSKLLTCGEGKYIELPSPFDPGKLDIIINNSVSTKYNARAGSIDTILETIETVTNAHEGNYIVFFPSYQYMNMVADKMEGYDFEIITQKSNMTDLEKNEIIEKFKTTTNTKVGLFVLGGAFSEGIDFVGDSLSGVIIVGVGLPLVCEQNNILKDYFEIKYEKGFDYAYKIPGFVKVIQAVGRVIRDSNDKGVAILLDERFAYRGYTELFPNHWKNVKIITNTFDLKRELKEFYDDTK